MNGQLNEIQLLENSKLSPHPPPTWERKSRDKTTGFVVPFQFLERQKRKEEET